MLRQAWACKVQAEPALDARKRLPFHHGMHSVEYDEAWVGSGEPERSKRKPAQVISIGYLTDTRNAAADKRDNRSWRPQRSCSSHLRSRCMLTKAFQISQATLYPAAGVHRPRACCRACSESDSPAAKPVLTTRRHLNQALASALLIAAAPAGPCIAQPAAVQEAPPSIVPRGPLSDRWKQLQQPHAAHVVMSSIEPHALDQSQLQEAGF